MAHVEDQAFWDRMYSHRAQQPWDPAPNDVLAEVAAGLVPGTAWDVGCGEGADALWLAARGWAVTATDHSPVALDRARSQDPRGQVAWRQADMYAGAPGAFDLVAAHYLHVPPAQRPAFFGGLAASTKPGGTLVVVAHHPDDPAGRPAIPDLYFTAEEVAGYLPAGWTLVEAGTRRFKVLDMVLVARRS